MVGAASNSHATMSDATARNPVPPISLTIPRPVAPPRYRQPKKNIRVWMSDGADDIENATGSWPMNNIQLANSLKMRGYDFHFRFGVSMHAIAQGALDLPESLTWLWRDYDPKKTEQVYQMEESEKAKPLFRVSITNREAW